jgi:hypothetical protein
VPLDLSFSTRDRGETSRSALRQIVDPVAGPGERNQESLSSIGFDGRVMSGHMDDALGTV